MTAAKSGVSIRLGAVRASAVAIFDPNRHIVTVNSRYAGFSARGLAAVLAHELRHVSNWSGVTGIVQPLTRWNCYTDEASAFTTEIAVWKEIKGDGPPADRLELEENDIAREMDTRGLGFWLSMTDSYHSECG